MDNLPNYAKGALGARARAALHRLGLSPLLIKLVRDGTLLPTVQAAYAELDDLNARLDIWEAEHPELVSLVPWYQTREAWKAGGRIRPPWYEAIRWYGHLKNESLLEVRNITEGLLNLNTRQHRARLKKERPT